jgi:hypothetical protein
VLESSEQFSKDACKFLSVRTLLVPVLMPVLVPVVEDENGGFDRRPAIGDGVMIHCAGQRVPVHNAGCYRNVAAKNVTTAKNGSPPMPGIIITNGSAPKSAVAKPARRRAKNSGIPKLVVFIEHDIAAIRQIADQVIVMDEGKIIAQGKPAEVLERPEIIEAYVA